MDDSFFNKNDLNLFDAVLGQACRDLQISDETRRAKLRDNIFALGRKGVRDFDMLRDYAAWPKIHQFSVVDPA